MATNFILFYNIGIYYLHQGIYLLPPSVRLSVGYLKSSEWISKKFCGMVGLGPENNWVDFGGDLSQR